MALYAISDLHLPLGVHKPMDIFGSSWANYVDRLHENWQNVVTEEDTVVLPGDFSWATYLTDAERDFAFLHSLKGRKILLKGNHDYWWDTLSKLNRFTAEKGYHDIQFLQNNHFLCGGIAICGTRGWLPANEGHRSEEDQKIYSREIQRLELSLVSAPPDVEKIVFTHYPPLTLGTRENEFTAMMKKYNVRRCIYGHLHAKSAEKGLQGHFDAINYLLVSCDYLRFMPTKLEE